MSDLKNLPVFRRSATVITGLVGLALAASACGGNSGAASNSGPIKIGVTLSLTGPIAAIGAQELAGVKLAVQTINDAGGVNGRQLSLDVTDDKYAPDQAVLNIRKLAQGDVVAIVGPGSSNSTVAGGQTANQLQVPLIALPSTVGDIWEGGGTLKWAFGTAGDGGALGAGCFKRFGTVQSAAGKPVKKIAIGQEESPGPISYMTEIKKAAAAQGVQIVGEQKWGGNVTDLTTQVNALLKSNPDALVLSTQTQSNILALKAMDQLGALGTVPLANCSAVDVDSWHKAVGTLAEKPNTYLMTLADDVFPAVKTGTPNETQRQAVLDAFTKYPKLAAVDHLSNFAGSGWDTIQLIANAIKAKGSSRSEIRDGLEQGKPYPGATATVAYGLKQHRALYEDWADVSRLIMFRNGQPQLADK